MYAGDTVISDFSKCLSKLQDELNQDLVNLQNWLHGNKLYQRHKISGASIDIQAERQRSV